jgi:hypothetical protein
MKSLSVLLAAAAFLVPAASSAAPPTDPISCIYDETDPELRQQYLAAFDDEFSSPESSTVAEEIGRRAARCALRHRLRPPQSGALAGYFTGRVFLDRAVETLTRVNFDPRILARVFAALSEGEKSAMLAGNPDSTWDAIQRDIVANGLGDNIRRRSREEVRLIGNRIGEGLSGLAKMEHAGTEFPAS